MAKYISTKTNQCQNIPMPKTFNDKKTHAEKYRCQQGTSVKKYRRRKTTNAQRYQRQHIPMPKNTNAIKY